MDYKPVIATVIQLKIYPVIDNRGTHLMINNLAPIPGRKET